MKTPNAYAPLILERYRELFKDEDSYLQFLEILSGHLESDLTPVLVKDQVLGSVLSPEATKEVLYQRMVEKMADTPGVIDEIKDRLQNDEIVD